MHYVTMESSKIFNTQINSKTWLKINLSPKYGFKTERRRPLYIKAIMLNCRIILTRLTFIYIYIFYSFCARQKSY